MNKALTLLGMSLVFTASPSQGEHDGPWNRDALYPAPTITETNDFAKEGFRSFYYESIPYQGKSSRVYAYYKEPEGAPPKGGWPAVVCVHGGGGTAYTEWIDQWVQHGFAAIAMDLEGRLPDISVKTDLRPRIEHAGPLKPYRWGDYAEAPEEQWFYHAVAQTVLAHSLLRSFPNINPNKTGIIGVSWGGILTCVAAAVDHRFHFAITSYGCGFLHESEGLNFDAVPNSHRESIIALWDPSNYLPQVQIPFLWLNGTNDPFFPLDVWEKSASLPVGPIVRRIDPKMEHGHKHTWQIEDIYTFAQAIVMETGVFPKIQKPSVTAGLATALCNPDMQGAVATLHFTTDRGLQKDREWRETPATLNDGKIQASIPQGASALFFNITPPSGMSISSPYLDL